MRVRGTSGRSASAARRGGGAQAAGTARARLQQRPKAKNAYIKIMMSYRNSAIVMRFDLRAVWEEAVGLLLLVLKTEQADPDAS